MIEIRRYKVAAYIRISKKEKEVNSISNQKDLIDYYIKDKEDGTISMTSRTKKTSQKDQKINPTIIDQVLSLARENKSSIESIKILEKKVGSLVTD